MIKKTLKGPVLFQPQAMDDDLKMEIEGLAHIWCWTKIWTRDVDRDGFFKKKIKVWGLGLADWI